MRSTKAIALIGLLVFLVQALFSQVYYLERMACYDPAFFSFLMLDSGTMESALGRHGTYLSQFLPWLALKAEASLEMFLRTYSISFILLYVLWFAIALFALRDKVAALAIVIVCTVGFHFSFYYPTAEIYQGLALCFLLWALFRKLESAKKRWPWILLIIALTVWISMYHQLLIIPASFMMAVHGLARLQQNKGREWLIPSVLVLAWMLIRIFFFEKSSYELNRMVTFEDFKTHLTSIHHLPSWIYFRYEINELPALILCLVFAGTVLLLRRNWLTLIAFGGWNAAFLVLILITDHAGQSPVMYENYYTVFGFFCALPVAMEYFRKWRIPVLVHGFSLVILVVGLFQIQAGHRPFKVLVDHHTEQAKRYLDRGIHKGLRHHSNQPWSYAWIVWSEPFTSTLVSAVKNEGQAFTVFPTADVDVTLDTLESDKQFLGPDWEPDWFTSDNLNERIIMPDQMYISMTTIDKNGQGLTSVLDSIEMWTTEDSIYCDMGPKSFVRIHIANIASDTLHARTWSNRALKLYYELDAGDGIFKRHGELISLDSDVLPGETMTTYLVVKRPHADGDFRIRYGLFSEEENAPVRLFDEFTLIK